MAPHGKWLPITTTVIVTTTALDNLNHGIVHLMLNRVKPKLQSFSLPPSLHFETKGK
jgi:hypothetical protein